MDKEQFNTGDILLYEYTNIYNNFTNIFFSLFNSLISWATNSDYSHSSIIIKDPQFTDPPLKGLYVLESSYETFPDAENKESKLGVELVSLDRVIEEYHGKIFWRKLVCDRNKTFYDNLAKAHSVAHNRPYDLVPSDWIKAALHINKGNEQQKKRFWCSALVAYVYVKLGLLSDKTPWTTITPKMLGTESTKEEVVFQNCSLEPEKQIK